MRRSRGEEQQVQPKRFDADLSSQLAGLRQRAAVRAVKERTETAKDETFSYPLGFQDIDESPSDSGVMSEDIGGLPFDSTNRFAQEARRRANLNSSEAKESIATQLTGLKRRSKLRREL